MVSISSEPAKNEAMKAPGKPAMTISMALRNTTAGRAPCARKAPHAGGQHILLADLVEEGVLDQERRGGEGVRRHGGQRQRHVPEVVGDALGPAHQRPAVGGEAAQRKIDQKEPPANSTISRMPNRKLGTA